MTGSRRSWFYSSTRLWGCEVWSPMLWPLPGHRQLFQLCEFDIAELFGRGFANWRTRERAFTLGEIVEWQRETNTRNVISNVLYSTVDSSGVLPSTANKFQPRDATQKVKLLMPKWFLKSNSRLGTLILRFAKTPNSVLEFAPAALTAICRPRARLEKMFRVLEHVD